MEAAFKKDPGAKQGLGAVFLVPPPLAGGFNGHIHFPSSDHISHTGPTTPLEGPGRDSVKGHTKF